MKIKLGLNLTQWEDLQKNIQSLSVTASNDSNSYNNSFSAINNNIYFEEKLASLVTNIINQPSSQDAALLITYLQKSGWLQVDIDEIIAINAEQNYWENKRLGEVTAAVLTEDNTYFDPNALNELKQRADIGNNSAAIHTPNPVNFSKYIVLSADSHEKRYAAKINYYTVCARIRALRDTKGQNNPHIDVLASLANCLTPEKPGAMQYRLVIELNLKQLTTEHEAVKQLTADCTTYKNGPDAQVTIANLENKLFKHNELTYFSLAENEQAYPSKRVLAASALVATVGFIILLSVLLASHGLATPLLALLGHALLNSIFPVVTMGSIALGNGLINFILESNRPGFMKNWLHALWKAPFTYANGKVKDYKIWQKLIAHPCYFTWSFAKTFGRGLTQILATLIYAASRLVKNAKAFLFNIKGNLALGYRKTKSPTADWRKGQEWKAAFVYAIELLISHVFALEEQLEESSTALKKAQAAEAEACVETDTELIESLDQRLKETQEENVRLQREVDDLKSQKDEFANDKNNSAQFSHIFSEPSGKADRGLIAAPSFTLGSQ